MCIECTKCFNKSFTFIVAFTLTSYLAILLSEYIKSITLANPGPLIDPSGIDTYCVPAPYIYHTSLVVFLLSHPSRYAGKCS